MAQQTKKKNRKRSAAQQKSGAKRSDAQKKRPIRREVWGGVCLLLALCIGVSYFQEGAILIDQLSRLARGLFGYGYYFAIPSLVLAAYVLLFHHGHPVRLRTFGALALMIFVGALVHLFAADADVAVKGAIKVLWTSGLELRSGGVLAGGLAMGALAIFGKVASTVILIALLLTCLLAGLRLTPAAVLAAVRSYERPEYEEEEEEDDPVPARVPEGKRVIDIPLDGEKRQKPPEKKHGLFPRRGEGVRTPDELLAGGDKDKTEKPPVSEKAPEPEFVPAPIGLTPIPPEIIAPAPVVPEPVAPTPIAPEPDREPIGAAGVNKKAAAGEIDAETEKVASAIEEELSAEHSEYAYPPITLLDTGDGGNVSAADAELRNNSRRLAETLQSFGVDAKPGDVVRGPSVTRYEFTLDQGVKLSKITNLQDDIALALGASGVRIAPIPDKISVVGIEVPNKLVSVVRIRDVLESREFTQHSSNVAFAVGKDIGGNNIVGNISKLPHVLIAGTTGSGKSVCTNSLIVSMLYKSTPDEVRFIMVDPKMVELAPYNGIPHLLIPVVTDPKKAAGALQWAVYEMMKRYKLFSEHNVKDLASYNALAANDEELKKLPTVVVVIDELADLMLVAAREVEESICRVAQMGRAAGMHLVIATQRPSADVITGLMKANIPSRIAFAVASSLESRIILDNSGAEKLVGRGDMLYAPLGEGKPRRVQGCLISAEEIDRVVGFVKANGEANYSDEVMKKIEEVTTEPPAGGKGANNNASPAEASGDESDELLPAAIDVLFETGQASVSMLQRRLKLGYSRAARLVDQMEERGIVGSFEGSKPRKLLITKEKWEEIKMRGGLGAMSAQALAAQETPDDESGEN